MRLVELRVLVSFSIQLIALPGRIELYITYWKHGCYGRVKQFIIMKMCFNPVFWSLVEVEEVIMLCLQFPSTLCPDGAETPEEELWGKI